MIVCKKISFRIILVTSIIFTISFGQEDESKPVIITKQIETGKIKLDGLLEESEWKMVQPVTNFIQRDPHEGEPSTEKSEVYVIFDENNLYIGAMLYDRDPSGILAYQKRRDQSLRTDDRFMWILDTFFDGRTGYFFEVNPAKTTTKCRLQILVISSIDF